MNGRTTNNPESVLADQHNQICGDVHCNNYECNLINACSEFHSEAIHNTNGIRNSMTMTIMKNMMSYKFDEERIEYYLDIVVT